MQNFIVTFAIVLHVRGNWFLP